MAPLDLDGATLGERHQHYNNLFKTAIANRQPVGNFALDDTDIEKLLKIDLASHNRDVDYIINVFKHGDMLCVSRALAQSLWLVTEPEYAHVINPEYLHTQLLQHMSTKGFIKLNKYIRHNIQDEARAEQFYLHEKKLTDAIKWLPRCSVTFIESKVEKHIDHCKLRTFKRLCEKSNSIFEIVIKKILYYEKTRYAQGVMFLLKADVDKYLDILEKDDKYSNLPKFNDKATDIIMKKSPKRIMDNFDRYVSYIDLPTFSRYLKTDEIKTFLYTQAKKESESRYNYNLRRLFNFDSMKYFVKRLPKTDQFEFVKKIFIDKENVEAVEENLKVGTEPYDMKKLYNAMRTPGYIWYRFASFERAFEDITGIISKDLDNSNKAPMLKVLMSCAEHNLQHIQTLLDYYLDKHKNEEYRFTLNFTTELLQHTNIHQYDDKTWNLVNELFKLVKIYEESSSSYCGNNNVIIECIIVYNLLRDQTVPAVIQQQFSFLSGTLISYGSNLNEEQKEKIFRYLYDNLIVKFKPITKEEEFSESIKIIESILRLLRDWKKKLTDYPFVTDKIKECVKIKREKAWKDTLLPIYNFNKSWRKHMFEESVAMNPCEEVCLNALKHDPELLQRYKQDVDTLQTNDAVTLRRLLSKLRIYWPHSLAQCWIDAYLLNLNRTDGHKATIRGICSALAQKPLLEFIEKYKPAQAKIDWNGIDDRILSIQRFIAKNMHIARPQPSPDTILLYAKGDYLQFALPSLLAIFYNLNATQSQEHIPKLLDSPVSVQKHGIRLAYQKLDHESVKKIFFDCWKASKNASIRAIIFKFTFELLCREKDPVNAVSLWELIELFIDNLSFEEDKKIYDLMANIEKVPLNVRAKYLMKSYKFMKSLTLKVKEEDRAHYEVLSSQLAQHSREIMEDVAPDFVTDIIQEFIDKQFFGSGDNCGTVYASGGILSVLSAYLLCTKNENSQTEKYEKVFVPIMQRAFNKWGEKRDGNYVTRVHFQYLLSRLSEDLKEYVTEKNMIIPVKMFLNIQDELDKNLSVSENYMLLTKWKLTVAVAKLADKSNSDSKDWGNIATEIAPEFGKICLDYLKEDVKLHFPCIYKLFSKALNKMFSTLIVEENNKVKIYECMLADTNFIQGYLTTIDNSSDVYSYDKENYGDLWKKIFEHPSVEVKMHYYYRSGDERRY